jgi:nicotinamide mononucleotide transporter
MELLHTIAQQLLATSPLEWIAFCLALLQVFFAIKNRAVNYLFGIASVAIYIYLFFVVKLYADASLNVYYLFISIYGFVLWQKESITEQKISRMTSQQWKIVLAILFLSFTISYFVLTRFTDSTVPVWDSAVAALAWAGTWLMTKRVIENWLFLSASNLIAIPLYHFKQLEATALLTVILLVMGLVGYWQWRKEVR